MADIKIGLTETGGNGAVVKSLDQIKKATSETAAEAAASAAASDAAFDRKMKQLQEEIEEQRRLQAERKQGAQAGASGAGGDVPDAAGPTPVKEEGLMASIGRMRTGIETLRAAWNMVKGAADDAVKANPNGPAQALLKSLEDVETSMAGLSRFYAEGLGHLIDPENRAGKFAKEVSDGLKSVQGAAEDATIRIDRMTGAIAKSAEEARRLREDMAAGASAEERSLNQERRLSLAQIPDGDSNEEKARKKNEIEMDFLTKQTEVRDRLARQTSESLEKEAQEKLRLAQQTEEEVAKIDEKRLKKQQDFRENQDGATKASIEEARKGNEETLKIQEGKRKEAETLRKEADEAQQKAFDEQRKRTLAKGGEDMDAKIATVEGANAITKAREADAKLAEQEQSRIAKLNAPSKASANGPKADPFLPQEALDTLDTHATTATGPQANSPQSQALRAALDSLKDGANAGEMGILVEAINELATTMKAQNYGREIAAMRSTVEQLKRSIAQDRN